MLFLSLKRLSVALFLCFMLSGVATASENIFLKGMIDQKEVMVRLSTFDPDEEIPTVFGKSHDNSDIYRGAYYEVNGSGIETFLVARLSPENKKKLTVHSVVDGKVSDTPWTFVFSKEFRSQEKWEGTYSGQSGAPVKVSLHVWLKDWSEEPENNEEYNEPRLSVPLKKGPEVRLKNGMAYVMMTDPLAGTIYPRLLPRQEADDSDASPEEMAGAIEDVNALMDHLQKNLMKSQLQCLANGKSTPGKVVNETEMTLLTESLLSASMYYTYSNSNPDSNDCPQYPFPDPLNVALISMNMDAGEILGLEDMFSEKVVNSRALQQYAWRQFSKKNPDLAENCKGDFSEATDEISLHFSESGAVFEMALDDDRQACAKPIEISGSFLRRLVKSGSPLDGLWPL